MSAERSGLAMLPYQASNTGCTIVVGILIGIVGWYVPFVWAGSTVFAIGCGLLYTLKVDSDTARLVGYQVIAGAGLGVAFNVPFVAAQVVSGTSDLSSASESHLPHGKPRRLP
jgi:hydrogenase/urease accessory protein HupE